MNLWWEWWPRSSILRLYSNNSNMQGIYCSFIYAPSNGKVALQLYYLTLIIIFHWKMPKHVYCNMMKSYLSFRQIIDRKYFSKICKLIKWCAVWFLSFEINLPVFATCLYFFPALKAFCIELKYVLLLPVFATCFRTRLFFFVFHLFFVIKEVNCS